MTIKYFIRDKGNGAYCEGDESDYLFDDNCLEVPKCPEPGCKWDNKKKKWIETKKKKEEANKENENELLYLQYTHIIEQHNKKTQKEMVSEILEDFRTQYKRLPKNDDEFILFYALAQE